MSEIKWEDPPRVDAYPRGGKGKHAAIAEQLKARPGVWGRVFSSASAESARSMAYFINRAVRVKAYEPAGSFEAVSRKIDGETHVYARYVGGGGS